MKRVTTILIILISCCQVFGQEKQVEIIREAQLCANSFVIGDYHTFISFMYPSIIVSAGGKDSLSTKLKAASDNLKAKGFLIKAVKIGEPGKIYNAGKELHCLIPSTLTLKIKTGYLVAKGYWLAISSNNGKSWYFLDLASSNTEKLKKLFPNFNNNLIIPEHLQPTFYKDSI